MYELGGNAFRESLVGKVLEKSWVGTCSVRVMWARLGWERVPLKLSGKVLKKSWVGTCSVKVGWVC